MATGSWDRVSGFRVSRRRALAGAATLGAGAAAVGLVACGGGGGGRESATTQLKGSGLLSLPEDTTAKARTGGTMKDVRNEDLTSMDALANNSFTRTGVSNYVYPRLLQFKTAKYPNVALGEVQGELAESFELSGDKLQITFKIRQGLKWDPRSPTNSRVIDAQDVVFSWKKFTTLNSLRGDILYAESNPGAPVMDLTAIDANTVIAKLHHPDSSALHLFASNVILPIMPRESDGGFDPKGEARGYGPWVLAEYKPSQGLAFTRIADYYVRGRPFVDRWEVPIVPEYATRLAQFRAGNIYSTVVTQDDVIQTKKDVPATLLRQDSAYSTGGTTVAFGYEGNSPFKDKRMRQAASMLIDRDAITDAVGNRDKFAADGLDIAVRASGLVTPGFDAFWVDPRDEKKFGPNARNLNFNPGEAKKLVAAAGYASGVDTDLIYRQDGYSATYLRLVAIASSMMSDGGIRAKQAPREYQTDFLPNYHFGYVQGDRKGFSGAIVRAETSYPSIGSWLFSLLNPGASRYLGATADGKDARQGDPALSKMIDNIRAEFDLKKQVELVREVDKYLADQMYGFPLTVYSLGFGLWWPVIGNLGVSRGYTQGAAPVHERLDWWVDETKAPIAKT